MAWARPWAGAAGPVLAVLAPDERARLERFRAREAGTLFLSARLLLRGLLARRTGVPAAAWRFEADERGRPEVARPEAWAGRARFNLTHTHGLVACALARDRAVGIDAESVSRPVHLEQLAERFFAPVEAQALLRLPPERRRTRFFEHWTLKEAYLKARGVGLGLPLDGFAFTVEPPPPAVAFSSIPDDPSAWSFDLLRPTDDHVLAVATALRAGVRPRLLPAAVDLAELLSPVDTGAGRWLQFPVD